MKRIISAVVIFIFLPIVCPVQNSRATITDANQFPAPLVTDNSVEICLNSRYSQHSLGGTASMQQISQILWAAGQAPLTGAYRNIFVATPDGTYSYDPHHHRLSRHSNQVTDDGAFALIYDSERDFDTGVSFMPALLASVSLCRSTESPVASCPKGLGYPKARLIFGVQSSRGLTSRPAAQCSIAEGEPGWLPDPSTTADNSLEEVLANLKYVSNFGPTNLTLQQISQLLWAGYGCTDHTPSGKAGLTVPSAWANYYLTGTIYPANEDGVFRYHNRNPATNLSSRDHRLEQIDSSSAGRAGPRPADSRARLRSAVADLPEAPCYIIICLDSSDVADEYARLETGFVAGNMLIQATALNLGCHFISGLSSAEQSGIRAATNIPATHVPQAIVSIGPLEAVVSIAVALQGDSRPNAAWSVPLTVRFLPPGSDLFNDPPAYEFLLTTSKSADDDAAVCEATGIAPGTYDMTVQGDYTLMNLRQSVVVSAPNTSIRMGTLLEGNANMDDRIDLGDFAIFSLNWPASDPQTLDSRADFDGNGRINTADLSLLADNWLMSSPVDITP